MGGIGLPRRGGGRSCGARTSPSARCGPEPGLRTRLRSYHANRRSPRTGSVGDAIRANCAGHPNRRPSRVGFRLDARRPPEHPPRSPASRRHGAACRFTLRGRTRFTGRLRSLAPFRPAACGRRCPAFGREVRPPPRTPRPESSRPAVSSFRSRGSFSRHTLEARLRDGVIRPRVRCSARPSPAVPARRPALRFPRAARRGTGSRAGPGPCRCGAGRR